ncbi:MAG: type II CAAX endopeptidase family protein [Bacilli bacterium]|nr:type II CAAX endopeptidase family protein [Bacilli bacterium]
MNNKKVLKYLGITFSITWGIFILRAILCNLGIINAYDIVGYLLFGLAVLGPAVAGYLCMDNRSPKNYIKMFFNHKKGTSIYIIGFSILYFISFYASTFKFKPDMPIYIAPLIFVEMFFFGGSNEELGWSSVLYPELEKKYNPILATGITLIIWFCWHLPLFITKTDMHYGMSMVSFFLFLFTMIMMKTAILRRTESIFYCGIIHALANVYDTMIAYEANTIMVIFNIIIWVVSFILWYYPKDKENNDDKKEEEIVVEQEEVITPIVNPELSNAIDMANNNEVEELI